MSSRRHHKAQRALFVFEYGRDARASRWAERRRTVNSRLAGPGTVRAWEETGIARGISRRLSSFPGLLDLCARLASNVSMASLLRARYLRGLPCFCFPDASSPNISCFGSLFSSMRMAYPTQRSRLFRIMASMLVDSAMSRTCRLETRSCHLMFRLVRRLRIYVSAPAASGVSCTGSMSHNLTGGW